MKDKSLGIWLMVLFGGSGLAAVVLGWSLPGLQTDRLAATLVGLGGIAVAVIRGLMLRKDRLAELALDVAEEEE
jgi:hypothetical protein